MGGICESKSNINYANKDSNNNIYNLNYICQINSPRIKGIGLFLKIFIDDKILYCIITNTKLNKKELSDLNESIEVYYNYNTVQRKFIINLNENNRFLRYYENINTTVIQILIKKDDVPENYFFSPRPNYENLGGEKIYISQISDDNKCCGEITKVNKNKFTYSVNEKNGSLGNFVFLENTNELIGINLERKINDNENYGYFLSEINNLLMSNKVDKSEEEENKEMPNETNIENSNYETMKINNEIYYIGQVVNGKMHGKGKIFYYKNNSIMYEGDFVDNDFDGNGKYIFEDGAYYVGQFIKGKRHGKGTLHRANGNIM